MRSGHKHLEAGGCQVRVPRTPLCALKLRLGHCEAFSKVRSLEPACEGAVVEKANYSGARADLKARGGFLSSL